jgi:DHA2 family methylenomycin A resistance protein-like MFS transporter
VLTAVTAGYFLVLLDITIINVALPTVSSELHADLPTQQWVIDAYAISLACLLLSGGKLGDMYGFKRVMLAGLTAFGAASAACGLATGPGVLIAFRAVQGVGAAALLPASLAVITLMYHGDERAQTRAISVWATVGSMAMPAGPLVGGLLVQFVGWRAVFLINLPIVAAAVVLIARLVDGRSGARPRTRLDLGGITLGAATLCVATVAIIDAGHAGPSVAVVASAVAAVLLLGAFVLCESRHPTPVLPLGIFRSRRTATATVVTVLMSLVLLGTIFMITQYLQVALRLPPVIAGLAMTPLFIPLAACSFLAGRLLTRVGSAPIAVVGLVLGAFGLVGLSTLPGAGYGVVVGLSLVAIGAGVGLLTPAVVTAAMRESPPEHTGIASGVNNTARQTGGAIGAAVFGAVIGTPGPTVAFTEGVRTAALVGAALWAIAAVVSVGIGPWHKSHRSLTSEG